MTRIGLRSGRTEAGFSAALVRLAAATGRVLRLGLTLYGLALLGCPWPPPRTETGATPRWLGIAMPGHPERLELGRRLTKTEKVLWVGLETATPTRSSPR